MKVRHARFSTIHPQDLISCLEKLNRLPRSRYSTYDSGKRCLPGTRHDILQAVYDWINDKRPGNNILWLAGAAGTGKTTITTTIAAQLEDENSGLRRLGLGRLGATFFCRRDDITLHQPSLVFPTIAHRLAVSYPLLREGILSAVKADPDVGRSSIANQFQTLVLEPGSIIPSDLYVLPVVIIIDAVDECGDISTREPLLRCLREARRLPVWFKLLVSSRPEHDIMKHLAGVSIMVNVELSGERSTSDIRKYVHHCVESLRTERRLDNEWPGDYKVDQLVSQSGGLFVWAVCAFRFISNHSSPSRALDYVLVSTGLPQLDQLYRSILFQSLAEPENMRVVRSILGCVIVASIPLSSRGISTLLDIEYPHVKWVTESLASVLIQDSHSVIRPIHPSFIDFLCDPRRSEEFFIDHDEHNLILARGCLQQMNSKLCANICRLNNSTLLNNEISDVVSRLDSYVPEELSYSCQYWAHHVPHVSNHDPDVLHLLQRFCNEHALHWMEAMSLLGRAKEVIQAFRFLQSWLQVRH